MGLTAIYAGSFDPPTKGHEWVIRTASVPFDRLIVAIGENPAKKTMFTLGERMNMLCDVTKTMENRDKIRIGHYSGQFLADYARAQNASYLIRGIRDPSDFAYETTLKLLNENVDPGLETFFLMPPRNLAEVSSSNVKGMLNYKNWEPVAARFVSLPVLSYLRRKSLKHADAE